MTESTAPTLWLMALRILELMILTNLFIRFSIAWYPQDFALTMDYAVRSKLARRRSLPERYWKLFGIWGLG
jgi:hypothetical protein